LIKEDTSLNRKPSRGITGYIILLATLLLVAILLNGGLNQTVNRRIEYPELLSRSIEIL
jgi:cell division protease FtsH